MLNKWADDPPFAAGTPGRLRCRLAKQSRRGLRTDSGGLCLEGGARKALNLFFSPQTSFQGDKLPICTRTRAGFSRTVTVFVALPLTAVATNAVAREFRAADTQSEDHPTVQALRFMDFACSNRS